MHNSKKLRRNFQQKIYSSGGERELRFQTQPQSTPGKGYYLDFETEKTFLSI